MKTSDLMYTWAVIFFAAALLASGAAIVIAWLSGVLIYIGAIISASSEDKIESLQKEKLT